jgi:hypothetical protein
MKKLPITIITSIVLVFIASNLSLAQSVSAKNLRRSSNEFYNEEVKETTTHASAFETSSERIKRIQKNGARIYEFEVREITGSWQDTSKDGEITYQDSFRGNSRTIKFSRKKGQATIKTNIPLEGKNILPYTFSVNSISPL